MGIAVDKALSFALITGASSGIGSELAELFAKNRHNVALIARREDALRQLSSRLADVYGIQTLVVSRDLSIPQSAREIYDLMKKKGIVIDYLINNAGFITYGAFSEANWSVLLELIQLQVVTLTHLTKLFLADMLRRNSGGILNVGSTGSFAPGPYNAVYCAAKSYTLSLSEAIAEELIGTGVTVTTLCPGGTKTEFAHSDQSFLTMTPARVAKIGYNALMKHKRVVVPGLHNKVPVFLVRFLPRIAMNKLAKSMLPKYR